MRLQLPRRAVALGCTIVLMFSAGTACRRTSPTAGPLRALPPAVTDPTIAPPTGAADPSGPSIAVTGAPVPLGRVQGPPPLDDVLQDQGIPVTLPDGRTLWIFADTADLFTGPQMFQTSSAAFSEQATPTKLRFYVDKTQKPAEFLPRTPVELAKGEGTYSGLWPMGATSLPDGRVLISYSRYHITLSPVTYTFEGSGLFEYRYPGIMDLAAPVVATRLADDIWGPQDGPINSPVYYDGQVYFLTCEGWICYSLRTTPSGLADRDTYRWWTGSGWSADKAARQPMQFGSKELPGRNPSVQWVPQLGAFAMTDTSVGAPSQTGLVWLAPRPQGPWSAPAEFPLANCGTKGCYLPNLHPQSSTASSLRIAYSSGGVWGPTMWATDVPVAARAPQRSGSYAEPVVVADTAGGLGVLSIGPVEQSGARHISVRRPDQPSNLSKVSVAIEVTGTGTAGRVRVGPSGSPWPGSAIDYGPSGTVRRTFDVPVGPNGRIVVTNDGPSADIKVSLLGWAAGA
jgi:hypothetical protein